jgi:hypothetical protein
LHGQSQNEGRLQPKKGTINALWLGDSGSVGVVPNSGTLSAGIETMKDTLKSIGSFILGICILVGVGFLAVMFLTGGVWLGERVYPWLIVITAIALFVTILVLLPLSIFRHTRAFAGGGIYIASFVFGLTLWVWSLLTSYTLWGIGGVVVGLLFAGVGIVPIAILANLFHGLWSMVGELLLVTAITFGTRFFGIYLMTKAEAPDLAA